MVTELENVKVGNLMTDSKDKWDEEILQDIFNDRDIELIKRIPISKQVRHDSWFWISENTGNFIVKSCYRQLVGEQHWPYAEFWKKLWTLDLPGKVLNFMWRVCKSVIPTDVALSVKHVQIDTRCSWCPGAEENIEHVLFHCSFAKDVWLKAGVQEVGTEQSQGSVWEVFSFLFRACNREKLTLIAMVCWSLWNRRNNWVWNRVVGSGFGAHAGALNMLRDWKRNQIEKHSNRPGISSSLRRWLPPPQDWIKVNIDVAIFEATGSMGISSVIRNDAGEFIRARVHRISANMQPREAEAISLKEALSWTKDLNFKKCIFETDAKLLADACRGVQGRSYFHAIVLDCIDYFKYFDDVLVSFVHRSANGVAHTLARAAHSMSDFQEWIDVAPDFISDVLIFDSI